MSAPLHGVSIVAGQPAFADGTVFHAFNPADGRTLEPAFHAATLADLGRAVAAALDATPVFATTSGALRGKLLRAIAAGLDAAVDTLVDRAHLETALPRPRLIGETARTSGQLRLFAALVEEGSWVDARLDTPDPSRTPPKPDLRSMLRPIGPVAVFGAGNFPLAFSVAGGDTASALAAANPVIVKAHPAHPGTSELVGEIIANAIAATGLPAGIFSLLFDAGHTVGAALVQHPGIRAVGFTGSFRGGKSLIDLAARRPDPIPVYAEMGSVNPVFLLPGAIAAGPKPLASALYASFTLGAGQFCTKPGLVFLETSSAEDSTQEFLTELRALAAAAAPLPLLTEGIASAFREGAAHRNSLKATTGAAPTHGFSAQTTLFETTGTAFLAEPTLAEELFGPSTLIVLCESREQLLAAASALTGQLTATIHATDADLRAGAGLLQLLETKAGRIVVNGFPTGVEVGHAQVHGGPWPATSDGRSTSVGTLAILRFARPVAYQGLPGWALPPELQNANPLKIRRLRDGLPEELQPEG
jgi:NADP-dependent aldehyde dehydrogenase